MLLININRVTSIKTDLFEIFIFLWKITLAYKYTCIKKVFDKFVNFYLNKLNFIILL